MRGQREKEIDRERKKVSMARGTHPVGTPAEDVDSDDGQNKSSDFSMRALLVFGFVLRSYSFELFDDQIIEDEDEA